MPVGRVQELPQMTQTGNGFTSQNASTGTGSHGVSGEKVEEVPDLVDPFTWCHSRGQVAYRSGDTFRPSAIWHRRRAS
jgi:hypothetical protein